MPQNEKVKLIINNTFNFNTLNKEGYFIVVR